MSTGSPAEMMASRPQYVLVAQALIDDIRRGRYPVGELLPPETLLCTQFGVGRHTVREAMRLLIQRGLVSRQRGVGTQVISREPRAHYTQSTASLADLPRYVEETRLVAREIVDVLANDEIAELLECPAGQRWIHVDGFRYIGSVKAPLALTDIYIKAAYGGIKEAIAIEPVPVYALIERLYGIRVAEVKQDIQATVIEAPQARALNVAAGSAGLVITRRYYAEGGNLVEVAVNLHPADRFSYQMTLRLTSGS